MSSLSNNAAGTSGGNRRWYAYMYGVIMHIVQVFSDFVVWLTDMLLRGFAITTAQRVRFPEPFMTWPSSVTEAGWAVRLSQAFFTER